MSNTKSSLPNRTTTRPLNTPGTQNTGIPFDKDGVALQILKESAWQMANGMIAAAKISPDGAVIGNNISVAAATGAGPGSTGGISFFFPCDGFIVAIGATVQDGTPLSYGSTSLRVQQNGEVDVFQSANGGGAGLLTFAQINGNAQGLFPVRRRFQQASPWQLYVNNQQTGAVVVVDLSLFYVNTSSPRL